MRPEHRSARRVAAITICLLVGGCSTSTVEKCPYPSPLFTFHSETRNCLPPEPIVAVRTPRLIRAAVECGWRLATGFSDRWTHIVIHHSASVSGGARAFDVCPSQG